MEMPLVAKEPSHMAILDEYNAATNSSTASSNDNEETEMKEPSMTTTFTAAATTAKAPTLDAATVSTYASTVSSFTTSSLPPQPVTPDGSKSYRTLDEKENDPNSLRTVSMDEETPHYPRKSFSRFPNVDDLSSSDDDSSYFATQLPAPNSRRGSYMSSSSNYMPNSTNNDESNASLSFSDDESDDELLPNPHLVPRNNDYNDDDDDDDNHPITKMHSLSSLVSSASSDNVLRAESISPLLRAESISPLPRLLDGRQAPIMGQYFFPSPTSMASTTPPPPMIMQGYLPPPSGPPLHQPEPQLALPGYGSTLLASQYAAAAAGGQEQQQSYTNYGSNQPTTPMDSSFSAGAMGAGSTGSSASAASQGTGGPTGAGGDTLGDLKSAVKAASGAGGAAAAGKGNSSTEDSKTLKVYWQRWIMLMYMSILNLLSDWTCYSVAPIALLTEKAFGDIDPERLVVVFLGANAVASACEPIILARLGLRKTVLFGSLLLMVGSLVKSGGIPPIIPSDLRIGHDEWRLYLGFFLVGLSQPLYQCTPALLSASWFPEKERTMATGVALNANQLGIGFAFIFGTLLVSDAEDIPNYFGLLTLLSTIVFLGTLIQFDDAPPTPPSSSARVMRGTMEMNLPNFEDIMQSVRNIGASERADLGISKPPASAPSPATDIFSAGNRNTSGSTRRRGNAQRAASNLSAAPSPALEGPTANAKAEIEKLKSEASEIGATAPSPAMDGSGNDPSNPEETSALYSDGNQGQGPQQGLNAPPPQFDENASQGYPQGMMPPPGMAPYGGFPAYQYPYWDPRFQQQMQQQQAAYQQFYYYQQQQMQQQQQQQQMPQQQMPQQPQTPYYVPNPYLQPHLAGYDWEHTNLPVAGTLDEGAEPVITMTPHHLDIDIRDDQVLLSIRACLSRAGFVHALVAFTVSGIVINTLSTYMDYLVRLNGAPRYYTGVVGGTFQFMIMISSLIIGKQTDKTRAYYSVTIGMLVLGAFGLAECGVSLDENNGRDLRWALVIVAVLVGPLQPVSTELGVDVAYPLSENTVLVIQQLFSNLLSALFIPIFKALKDVGKGEDDERPEYTFSFYLLIVLHTAATVFFATFNGKYLRFEHELQKKELEEEEARQKNGTAKAFHPFYADRDNAEYGSSFESERQPLVC
mmetsp:Transcript_25107/g.61879  ORF Transcript_25107/g.61879 Transcript_25107/m.61879 type:complete len:1148 (+) Transcript_25107:294-3737(+)